MSTTTVEMALSPEDDDFDYNDEDECSFMCTINDLVLRLMSTDVENDDSPFATEAASNVFMNTEELEDLCVRAALSFAHQKSLLRIDGEDVVICGDLHGQFRDLRGIFRRCGSPATQRYLFLGDYVDRGKQGIEVVSLLLGLKVMYPDKVFLLRGNHEEKDVTLAYGFFDECVQRFKEPGSPDVGMRVWRRFLDVFDMMPVAAVVGGRLLCMHGGLSPHLRSLDAIEALPRPAAVPAFGLMCDLLWADPDNTFDGWATNSRGISFTFSQSVVNDLCDRFGIDLIVRAHQLTREMINNGYEFFADGRLVTIFSAPNYQNSMNDACVLRVSKELECSFIVFRPRRTLATHSSLSQSRRTDSESTCG